ncbi:ABC transporter permease [Aureibaculum sp. 2210JD6-5]|uniref:ABC transporter permease n=1 Tax=Aureibaculum sp. 2210JD6-5 TaxID=3103957 RepID=UPI002AAEF590|nr:ABC transporter permease [Aureibaculum sp. 2210JD6-5]MDY7393884.1 ABC transporter permease [Aureibaculum sp. 2210JD6-5]
MFKNYIKIAYRNLVKNKFYSVINIIGITVAIICLLFAGIYWNEEHSFDDFHTNNPNLYRITTNMVEHKGAIAQTVGGTGQVQGKAFKEAIPEIKKYTRVLGGEIYYEVSTEEKILNLNILFVDTNFFDVFTFPLLHGDVNTALSEVNSVVISESTAMRLFNTTNVVGKVLRMDHNPSFQRLKKPMVISAVAKDAPKNSSIQFEIVLPFSFQELTWVDTNWLNAYLGTFVVLEPTTDLGAIEQKFDRVFAIHAKDQVEQKIGRYGFDSQINYGLQNILDIHLDSLMQDNNSNIESGVVNTSNPIYSIVFVAIALLILIMAAINFINISIASAIKRAKEIGVRKIAGGSKRQIIFQFLIESSLLCGISFLLSLFSLKLLIPIFNELTAKQFVFEQMLNFQSGAFLILIFGSIILITGLYPAFVLSRLKPAEVLYNKLKWSGKNLAGRGLVVFQFSLGIFLLITAIVFYSQMDYIRTKDLGYNPNQIITTTISGNRDYTAIGKVLKEELSKESAIASVSYHQNHFSEPVIINNTQIEASLMRVDENYLPDVEIPILLGRNFSTDFSTDPTNSVVVNETFVKEFNLTEPVGQSIKLIENDEGDQKRTIIGVVKDFHFGSLREPIKPMFISMLQAPIGNILVKFEKSKQQEAIIALEKAYKTIMPDAVFTYNFLDEQEAKQYKQEQQWQKIVNIATILSLIICCIGLLGMARLSINQRIKEIGVRKVLGASVSQILTLHTTKFLKLVIIAFFIAAPIAWWAAKYWLQNFAYHIELSFWLLAFAGAISLLIGIITVSFQAIKAARTNPVKSLRTE